MVVDASVLINLLHTERLRLFCTLGILQFVVTPETIEEIRYPEQRALVEEAAAAGVLQTKQISGAASLRLYTELRKSMGKGEAASLALAKARGWRIASDDGKGAFRRAAVEHVGKGCLLTTADLYLMAIRAGSLSIEEADQDKAILEACRFKMPFTSFADLNLGKSVVRTRR